LALSTIWWALVHSSLMKIHQCWMETEVPQSPLPSTNGIMALIRPPRDRNPKKSRLTVKLTLCSQIHKLNNSI
jgi:hypothetical protein